MGHPSVVWRHEERLLPNLTRLNFDWLCNVHGTLNLRTDLQGLCVLHILHHHSGPGPIQVPSVLDGNDGVCAWDHIWQVEAAIEITLISAKKFAMVFGIIGHEHDHRASRTFACPAGKSLYIRGARCQGDRYIQWRPRSHV